MNIKELKLGEYFKKTATAKDVFVRGAYCKISKKYSCTKFDDVNAEQFISGNKEVFTDFTF